MWTARLSRLCVRLADAGGRTRTTLYPGVRRHAAVSAGWRTDTRICSLQSRRASTESPADEALPEFNIHVLVNLLRQENGKDLCVIRVPPEMKYADYFVVVGGTSTRHLQAMAQYMLKMYKFLKAESEPHVCLEGKDTEDWMCIDFGTIVIHFMLPETREIYELEKLWTLQSYDDQLSQIKPEILPEDFTFGLQQDKE
ncbi:negative regulation of mitochondrial translation [Pristimantis euphronides]